MDAFNVCLHKSLDLRSTDEKLIHQPTVTATTDNPFTLNMNVHATAPLKWVLGHLDGVY